MPYQWELILKHVMYVHRMSAPEVVLYKNIIEVSPVRTDESSPLDLWVYKNNLPAICSELYAKSIKLFIDDMISSNIVHSNNPQKPFAIPRVAWKMSTWNANWRWVWANEYAYIKGLDSVLSIKKSGIDRTCRRMYNAVICWISGISVFQHKFTGSTC